MSVFSLALIFFLVTNPIGNSPAIIALIKNHTLRDQQKILLRESIFAAIIAIFFLFMGDVFEKKLLVCDYALSMSGGILLLIVAFNMIFSEYHEDHIEAPKQDPFIVPIATPLLSGAGLLTIIMLYAKEEANDLKILTAIIIAFVGVTAILFNAPYLQLFLGKRGMAALEQFMGMLLAMMAMDLVVRGAHLFIKALAAV